MKRIGVGGPKYLIVAAVLAAAIVLPQGISSVAAAREPSPADGRSMGLVRCGVGDYPVAESLAGTAASLPPSYDLTLGALPVGDQSGQNSCVGWAVGYYYKTYQEYSQHVWDISRPDKRFSPSWLYNEASGGSGAGTTFPRAFEVLKTSGVVDIQEFPYNPADYSRQPTETQVEAAKPYRIADYAVLWTASGKNRVEEIKAHIAAGDPVALGIPVYENFYDCGGGWVDVPSKGSGYRGDHAVCAVGYDDGAGGGKGGVKIVNSWGSDWGDSGFTYLSYDFVSKWSLEAWVMKDTASDTPRLDSLSPTHGCVGSEVTITGDGFGADRGESRVTLGGEKCEIVSWKNESVKVEVPGGATSGEFEIANWAGEPGNKLAFDIELTVTCVSPEVARPGDLVHVYGGGFGGKPGEVLVGNDHAQIVSWIPGEIAFKAPGRVSNGAMSVTGNGGVSVSVPFRVAGSVWYLAEGYTGDSFEEWICIENPERRPNKVEVTYMTPAGEVARPAIEVPPMSRYTLPVDSDLPASDVSTRVVSDGVVLVERSMYWKNRVEGHASSGVPLPRTDWFLAEGTTVDDFDTWILVQNVSGEPADVSITYLTHDGPVEKDAFTVEARCRATVHANKDVPLRDFSAKITSSRPVVVERSMYWGDMRGGHCSSAADAADRQWTLAEGSTQFGFDEWVTVGNPNDVPANVDITYLTPQGPVGRAPLVVPALSRGTIHVNPEITAPEVSVRATSDIPVVVERSMYWNNGSGRAGHAALGVTQPSRIQFLAEGCTASGFDEWVLLANPSERDTASVAVTYLTPGGGVPGPRLELPPSSRTTVRVKDDLPSSDVSVMVESSVPVMVERAMYWGEMSGGTDSNAIPQGN